MGSFLGLFWQPPQYKVIILGIDGAGKTTVLYKLKLGEVVTPVSTYGTNIETLTWNGSALILCEVGGEQKIRARWKTFAEHSSALIFVVDAADHDRISEATEALRFAIKVINNIKVPVLVLANKSDAKDTQCVSEIERKLCLKDLCAKHVWHIESICAKHGNGLSNAMDWLVAHMILG